MDIDDVNLVDVCIPRVNERSWRSETHAQILTHLTIWHDDGLVCMMIEK